MAYTLKQLTHSVEISPVTDVVVTTISHDEIAGDYYREVRVLASENGVESVVASFKIRGAAADDIEIDVPASQF